MKISPAMTAGLALLSDALDDTGSDIAATIGELGAEADSSVSSFLGMTVRIALGERELAFAVKSGDDGPASSSVRIDLDPETPARPPAGHPSPRSEPSTDLSAAVVTLYAGARGAFVDLAADLAWLTGRPLDTFVLDEELDGLNAMNELGLDELRSASAVDQAVGVLIGQGRTPEQASADLDVRAAADGVDRTNAARRTLAELGERRVL